MSRTLRTERFRVKQGEKVRLADWSPDETAGFSEAEALAQSTALLSRLEKLQDLLYAGHKHKVLIVLQAMDTGGKDGTIKRVFEGVNPQGVSVAHFVVPTPEEADHDFLWRVHMRAPGSGQMTIFNRSHYEGVLVVRVHGLVPEKTWKRRYKDIEHFERLLTEEHTILLKFFLHISKGEQKKRMKERLKDPNKEWKFSAADVRERKFWPKYMEAYQEAIERTSTEDAPWYVVPSNAKWFRDLFVSTVIVERLEKLRMKYPKPSVKPKSLDQ